MVHPSEVPSACSPYTQPLRGAASTLPLAEARSWRPRMDAMPCGARLAPGPGWTVGELAKLAEMGESLCTGTVDFTSAPRLFSRMTVRVRAASVVLRVPAFPRPVSTWWCQMWRRGHSP